MGFLLARHCQAVPVSRSRPLLLRWEQLKVSATSSILLRIRPSSECRAWAIPTPTTLLATSFGIYRRPKGITAADSLWAAMMGCGLFPSFLSQVPFVSQQSVLATAAVPFAKEGLLACQLLREFPVLRGGDVQGPSHTYTHQAKKRNKKNLQLDNNDLSL